MICLVGTWNFRMNTTVASKVDPKATALLSLFPPHLLSCFVSIILKHKRVIIVINLRALIRKKTCSFSTPSCINHFSFFLDTCVCVCVCTVHYVVFSFNFFLQMQCSLSYKLCLLLNQNLFQDTLRTRGLNFFNLPSAGLIVF